MSRICLDSNVVVAPFAARGLCPDVVRLVLTEHELVVPERVAAEVRRVLRNRIRASPEALAAADALLDHAEAAPPTDDASPVPVGDPDDERILADALSAGCDLLVTGDDDLLSVASDPPIPIFSPRAFITLARAP